MAIIETINSAINSFVWGVPMLVLLVGAGILLTCRTCGVQFRKFGYAMKNTAGKIFKKGEAKEGEITPFQAMSTALAGTVGTGNIAGVTTALTLGGPGSMFWLWITALIGMATKYSEVLLAVKLHQERPRQELEVAGCHLLHLRGPGGLRHRQRRPGRQHHLLHQHRHHLLQP